MPDGLNSFTISPSPAPLSARAIGEAVVLEVATDEIRFGDNDTLAALVANLVEADLLVTKAYQDVETLTVNPLEASRVKAGVQAGLHQLLASRAALDKLLTRVEVEVRPLTDKSHALRNQVLISIERFGDAS